MIVDRDEYVALLSSLARIELLIKVLMEAKYGRTEYGHYIYADLVKGQEFVDFKEYLELDKIIKSKEEEMKKRGVNNVENKKQRLYNFTSRK